MPTATAEFTPPPATPPTIELGMALLRPSFEAMGLWWTLEDPTITEVMVVGSLAFIERHGELIELENVKIQFESIKAILRLLASEMKDHIGPSKPELDARLPNGFRLHATIPPFSPLGVEMTIRKFSRQWSLAELYQMGMMDEASYSLITGLLTKGNVLLSGQTSSGKTTMLMAMLAELPLATRIVTIEKPIELRLPQRNSIRLEAVEATGPYAQRTVGDGITSSLRMRPDFLTVGEVRDEEAAAQALRALSTGHRGATTIHAGNAKGAFAQIALLASGRFGGNITIARAQAALALQYGVHLERGPAGGKRVSEIIRVHDYNHMTNKFSIKTLYRAPQQRTA